LQAEYRRLDTERGTIEMDLLLEEEERRIDALAAAGDYGGEHYYEHYSDCSDTESELSAEIGDEACRDGGGGVGVELRADDGGLDTASLMDVARKGEGRGPAEAAKEEQERIDQQFVEVAEAASPDYAGYQPRSLQAAVVDTGLKAVGMVAITALVPASVCDDYKRRTGEPARGARPCARRSSVLDSNALQFRDRAASLSVYPQEAVEDGIGLRRFVRSSAERLEPAVHV